MMYQDGPLNTPPPQAAPPTGRLAQASEFLRRFVVAVNDCFAWSAGANLPALNKAPSERNFYSAVGGVALIFSCVSGLMIMIAVAYASGTTDVAKFWWIGILGMAVIISMERLVLQIEPAAGWKLAIAAVPRLAFSYLLASFVAGMVIFALYASEIGARISEVTAQALRKVQPEAAQLYGAKIDAAKKEISRLTANEQKVEQRIARQDLRAQQARVNGICTARCDYYRTLSETDREKLAGMKRRNEGRFEGRRAQMADLRADQRAFVTERRRSITERKGLVAREEALDYLKDRKNSNIRSKTLHFHLLLMAADLLAFIIKMGRVLTLGRDAYHAQHEADRAEQTLDADMRIEHVKTERSRILDLGRATRRSNKAKADFGNFFTPHDPMPEYDAYTEHTPNTGAPIETYGLIEATEEAEHWEKDPVDVPPVLRRGALFGSGVLLASLAAILLLNLGGLLIALPAVILAGVFLAQTKGFRTATAIGLRGTFATFLIGAAFPLFLLIHNL